MPSLSRIATPPFPFECVPCCLPLVLGEATTFQPLNSGMLCWIFFEVPSSVTEKLHSWITAMSTFMISSLLKSSVSLLFKPATFCCMIFREFAALVAVLLRALALLRFLFLVVAWCCCCFCCSRLGFGGAGVVCVRGFVGDTSLLLLLLLVGAGAGVSGRRLAPARALVSII